MVIGQSSQSQEDSGSLTMAGMADNGCKAHLNRKLSVSNDQSKFSGRTVRHRSSGQCGLKSGCFCSLIKLNKKALKEIMSL